MPEADTPAFGLGEDLLELLGGVVDRERRNQRAAFTTMTAPPRHQPDHVIVADVGDDLVLAEEVEQQADQVPRTVGADVMLADLGPIAARNVIEPQRGTGRDRLGDVLLGLVALGGFYFFRVALGPGFG